MRRIAEFQKVSPERFAADWRGTFREIEPPYDAVALPRRATAGSAGYDFIAPVSFELLPGDTLSIPTGIRARIDPDWALFLFPRSGLGFKYRLQLNNTVGIVDSDYYGALNEGHIFIRLHNAGERPLRVNRGEAFAQGVFLPYGVTLDDDASAQRTGGFGSTDATKGDNAQ